MRELELDLPVAEHIGEGLIAVPEGSTAHVDVRLESLHDGILASGDARVELAGECSRCLEPITDELEVDFAELFAYARDEAYEYVVEADHVDLEPAVRDAVVLALPFQPVCRPDCLGLDPATGEKLQQPLPDRAEPTDPRWAALTQFDASDSAPASPTE
ncbi:DUF177 domain-containing protein [Pseudoclavibacter chungangensis]|uniref:DUF177 domain-containing protein n=2 Tax=Pseudoclavibacter chungangensis TaxID=587635 RepID=A0A7J5BZD8_9MICO|nr:YceD family protein [Pseudoclavibacter chungangensis]KAB1659720.1 DUF177 domain-containing protein [Pseudoclavibacter chungangensis]